jgi:hypothetical protein
MHGENCSDWNGVPKSGHAFSSSNAHTKITLTSIKLGTFTRGIAQCVESRVCSGEKFVFTGSCSKFGDARSENEATVHVTGDKSMMFEGACKTMRGWSGEAGG